MRALRMKNLQKMLNRDALQASMLQATNEIGRLASIIGLPQNICEEALLIYKNAAEERLLKGRSRNAFAAASLYIACRKLKFPIILEEITKNSNEDKMEITRSIRLLIKHFNIRLPLQDPIDYVERLTILLNMPHQVKIDATEILKKYKEIRNISGKDPVTIAAAAVYLAGLINGIKKPQAEVAKIAYITGASLRKQYLEILNTLDFLKRLLFERVDKKFFKNGPYRIREMIRIVRKTYR